MYKYKTKEGKLLSHAYESIFIHVHISGEPNQILSTTDQIDIPIRCHYQLIKPCTYSNGRNIISLISLENLVSTQYSGELLESLKCEGGGVEFYEEIQNHPSSD